MYGGARGAKSPSPSPTWPVKSQAWSERWLKWSGVGHFMYKQFVKLRNKAVTSRMGLFPISCLLGEGTCHVCTTQRYLFIAPGKVPLQMMPFCNNLGHAYKKYWPYPEEESDIHPTVLGNLANNNARMSDISSHFIGGQLPEVHGSSCQSGCQISLFFLLLDSDLNTCMSALWVLVVWKIP